MARPASRISNVVMPGPLAPFAERYRLELLARGYTAHSAVNESRQVACLSRWLEDRGQEARDVSGGRARCDLRALRLAPADERQVEGLAQISFGFRARQIVAAGRLALRGQSQGFRCVNHAG